MANSANDHQYSLLTLRKCIIRKPPYPDWKERRNYPSTDWPENGSIGANLWVYSDNSPVDDKDGKFKWWPTTIGFIRGDGLDLKFDKVPAPRSPIDPTAFPADVQNAILLFETGMKYFQDGLDLLKK